MLFNPVTLTRTRSLSGASMNCKDPTVVIPPTRSSPGVSGLQPFGDLYPGSSRRPSHTLEVPPVLRAPSPNILKSSGPLKRSAPAENEGRANKKTKARESMPPPSVFLATGTTKLGPSSPSTPTQPLNTGNARSTDDSQYSLAGDRGVSDRISTTDGPGSSRTVRPLPRSKLATGQLGAHKQAHGP